MPVIVGSKGYVYIPSEKVIGAIIENENLLNEKKSQLFLRKFYITKYLLKKIKRN